MQRLRRQVKPYLFVFENLLHLADRVEVSRAQRVGEFCRKSPSSPCDSSPNRAPAFRALPGLLCHTEASTLEHTTEADTGPA
jgi:hypothetical protein